MPSAKENRSQKPWIQPRMAKISRKCIVNFIQSKRTSPNRNFGQETLTSSTAGANKEPAGWQRPRWFIISRYVYYNNHSVATQYLASPLLPPSASSNSQPLHPLRSMHTALIVKCVTDITTETAPWLPIGQRRSFQTHCPGYHSQPITQTHLSGHIPWQLLAVWITRSLNDSAISLHTTLTHHSIG